MLDQVGYLPNQKKIASLLVEGNFSIIDASGQEVYAGVTTDFGVDEASKDHIYLADFSFVTKSGVYQLKDALGNLSYHFTIDKDVYEDLHFDLLKAFYYQRCGCALEEKHAGIYHHKICHTKPTKIFTDPDVSKDLAGGWHDAGDYGRYVTPGAVAVGHLLYAYLLFPKSFDKELNIPESGNGMPDVLNECKYELDWILKMQREDGAVYHKAGTLMHAPFVMPEDDQGDLYAYPISSMATADFAAVMALAARIYQSFDAAYADTMLEAAKQAYEWLSMHKECTGFKNPEGTGTGEYGDRSDLDERLWAACELFVVTKEKGYLTDVKELLTKDISLTEFGWGEVSGLASMCILTTKETSVPENVYEVFKQAILEEALKLEKVVKESGYGLSLKGKKIGWGSNGLVGNHGMLFILAALLTKNHQYYEYALDQLHYLLGRNALDISYVTRYGENAFERPHNRPTEKDGIELPMPGWVSGGANGHPCDEAAIELLPKDTPPMKCYVDDWRSFSTNEITIYWNSPFVFLISAFLHRS